MDYVKVDFYNTILNGNIPFSVLECFKGFKEVYNNYTLINHPYLKIRNENVLEFNILSCDVDDMPQSNIVCKQHIKKSLNLNRNMIVNSLQFIIKNILIVIKTNYEKEITKYKTVDNPKNDDTIINKIYREFSGRLLDRFKTLRVDRDTNDVFLTICLIISLANLKIDIIQSLMFKLVSQFELNTPFMINQIIGIPNKYLNKVKNFILTDQNIDVFSLDLANDLLQSIEYVLNHMMTTTSKNKICSIYIMAINIADSIIGLASINTFRIVEHLDVASKKNITNTSRIKKLNETNETINQDKVIDGLTKLITTSITQALSSNKSELKNMVGLTNQIEFSGIKSGGSMIFKKIKQLNKADIQNLSNVQQTIMNKINTDIMNKVNENIDFISNEQSEKYRDTLKESAEGSNLSDISKDIANILKVSIASTTNMKTEQDVTDELKKTFTLNQNFTYKKNNENETKLNEVITNEQANTCSSSQDVQNALKGSNMEGSELIVEDIQQENIFNSVNTCITNQFTNNEISKKVYNEYDNIIKQLIDNVRTDVSKEVESKTIGDIYAAGVAGKQILEGAGETLKGAGEGIGTAATGLGEGAKRAGMGIAMAIGGGLLALLIIGFIIFKFFMPSLSGSSSSPPVAAPEPSAPELPESGEGDEVATQLKYFLSYIN